MPEAMPSPPIEQLTERERRSLLEAGKPLVFTPPADEAAEHEAQRLARGLDDG
jgi:hypothetical protein